MVISGTELISLIYLWTAIDWRPLRWSRRTVLQHRLANFTNCSKMQQPKKSRKGNFLKKITVDHRI